MGYKPKAEKSFEDKIQYCIETHNWTLMEEVTRQYEAYLQLIEPFPEEQKQLVHVPAGEPTVEEEQEYVLSGGLQEFIERTVNLTRDAQQRQLTDGTELL